VSSNFYKDLYGSAYKSAKTKAAAEKRKKTTAKNDAIKQATYERQFSSDVQSFAKKNHLSYNDNLKEAAKMYYKEKPSSDKFIKSSIAQSNKKQKVEIQSSFKFSSANKDKVDEYNSARKKMGLGVDNTPTQKEYSQMFGVNHRIGGTTQQTDTGMYNRFQNLANKTKPTSTKGVGSSVNKKVTPDEFKKNHPVLNNILSLGGLINTDHKDTPKKDKDYHIGKNYVNDQVFGIPGLLQQKVTGKLPAYMKDKEAVKTGQEMSSTQDEVNLALGVSGIAKGGVKQVAKNLISKKGIKTAIGSGVVGATAGELNNLHEKQLGNNLSKGEQLKNIATNAAIATLFGKALGGHTKELPKELPPTTKKLLDRTVNKGKITNPKKVEQLLSEVAKSETPQTTKLVETIKKVKKEPTSLNIEPIPKGAKISKRREPNGVLMELGKLEPPNKEGQLDPTTAPLQEVYTDEIRNVYKKPLRQTKSTLSKAIQTVETRMNRHAERYGQDEQFKAYQNEKSTLEKQLSDVTKEMDASKNWKTLWKPKLSFETPDRVFDATMGKDAEVMKQKYLEPIKTAEAEKIRWINSHKENIVNNVMKKYNIKSGSKDDGLIQMYGEGKISLEDLKKESKNWENIAKVTPIFQKIYKDIHPLMSDALTRNGYPSLGHIENYFPHFSRESKNPVKDLLGIDPTNNGLPTSIDGLTDTFVPEKPFNRNILSRTGDKTDFGAIEGLSQYLEGAGNLIHHTDNIKQLRNLEEALRDTHGDSHHLNTFTSWLHEYTNLLSGKKSKGDRGYEDNWGRGIYNVYKTVQRNIGKALVGGNINAALTGVVPTLTAAAQTDKGALLKGIVQTVTRLNKNDGFLDQSNFLTRRIGSDPLHQTTFDKVSDKAFWLMKVVDQFNAEVITRSKYNELINKGLPHQEAMKEADNFAAGVMADRSKGQMPNAFSSKTLGTLTQFQLEVANQLSHLFKDIPKNNVKTIRNNAYSEEYHRLINEGLDETKANQQAKEFADNIPVTKGQKAKRAALVVLQLSIYDYLFNQVYEKVTGRRPAFDPIEMGKDAVGFGKGDIGASKLIKDVAGQLPYVGTFVSGRSPLSVALPNVPDMVTQLQRSDDTGAALKDIAIQEAKDKTPVLLGVPGWGQMNKTYKGLKPFFQDVPGVYNDSGNLQYLVGNNKGNKVKGALFGPGSFKETQAYYDNKGRTLSSKQTNTVVNATDPKQAYNNILDTRLRDQIKRLDKKDLTKKEKDEKMKKLVERMKRLKGE
jgi:hypothetical protein